VGLVAAVLIIVAATAAAVAAMLAVRRRAPEGSYFTDGDRASGVFGVLATGFSVLLGLVVVLAFTSYDASRSGAETEALTVAQQFETAQFMPAVVRPQLSGQLICYGRTVVHRQWPALKAGTASEAINPWSIAMYRTLKATRPVAATEQSAYDTWMSQTSDRELAVQDRNHSGVGVIPAALWIALFIIGAVIVAYVLFFADSGEPVVVQAMLMGSVVAVMAVTLLLIRSLDNPYHGTVGSLKPVAMERTLRRLDLERQIAGQTGPLPCDATGAARAL